METLTAEQQEGLDGASPTRRRTLNELLFPGPTKEFSESRARYGDVSVLNTLDYLYGLRTASSTPSSCRRARPSSSASRRSASPTSAASGRCMATINGQMRPVNVRDRNVASDVAVAEKADTAQPGHVAAPFQGVVTVVVEKGATGRGRRHGRHHRGDEDGGLDHRRRSPAPSSGSRSPGTQAVDGGDLVLVLA